MKRRLGRIPRFLIAYFSAWAIWYLFGGLLLILVGIG